MGDKRNGRKSLKMVDDIKRGRIKITKEEHGIRICGNNSVV